MKIALAQYQSLTADVEGNVKKHLNYIAKAAAAQSDLIVFPELSITGYEPTMAADLAMSEIDDRLQVFQEDSSRRNIAIAVGIPYLADGGVQIAMVIWQPDQPMEIYSKQYLHEDEFPYFIPGTKDVILEMNQLKIGPAICYESRIPEHGEKAFQMGAKVYLASVAKPQGGVLKAMDYYPTLASRYKMSVLMANNVGKCDNFIGAGLSGYWNEAGKLLFQMGPTEEGLMICDLSNQSAQVLTV